MDWLERELQRALSRKEPAPDFAARVSAAARRKRVRPSRWMALAASLLVLAGAGAGYRWREGIRAKEQVMLAVRLAGGKLNQVQYRVTEVGR